MIKVYICGPYSATNIIQGLENIRAGQRMATKLLQKGFAVFCPWLDHQLFFQLREGEAISLEMIQAHSMEWLKVSDAVLVLKGYAASKGTLAEMKVAYELNKPVFFNPLDLYYSLKDETDLQFAVDQMQRYGINFSILKSSAGVALFRDVIPKPKKERNIFRKIPVSALQMIRKLKGTDFLMNRSEENSMSRDTRFTRF